ncbi:MAG: hypothetical protein WC004_02565 [Candidatus Absconditabacterales bacterium]
MSYSPQFESIVHEIDQLISSLHHEKKDIGYGYRWTFQNKHRVDCIDYKKTGTTILRVGRGALLVKKYPMLAGIFDEVLGVIAKMEIPGIQTLYDKHIIGVFEILEKAPRWNMNQMLL